MSDLPFSYQQELFARKNKTLAQIQQGRNLSPDVALRVASITRAWRDIKPGAVVSLAQAGYDASSPEVKQVAQVAIQQHAAYQQWQDRLSQVKTLAGMKISDQAYNDLPPAFQHAFAHHAQQLAVNEVGGGGVGGVLGDIADTLPVVGSLKSLAKGNYSEAAIRAIPGEVAGSKILDAATGAAGNAPVIGPSVRTAARTTAIAMQTPLDIMNASVRQGILNAKEGKFSLAQMDRGDIGQSASQVAQQTVAYQAGVKHLSVGDGILPDPHSEAAQAAAQAARNYSPYTIGEHAFTPGRALADLIFEPNTTPFRIMSGAIDAEVAIKMDPTARALGLVGEIRSSENVPRILAFDRPTYHLDAAEWLAATPEQKQGLLKLQDAGIFPTTGPLQMDSMRKTNWLASREFDEKVGGPVSQMTSPSEIKRYLGADVPVETVDGQPFLHALSRASTPDEVRDVFTAATEVDKPSMTGVTYRVRRALDSRLFSAMPYGSIADPSDKTANWKILDDIMLGANIPEARRNAVLDEYIRNPHIMAAVDGVSGVLKEAMMAFGATEKDAAERASFWRDEQYSQRMYDIDQATGAERQRVGLGIGDNNYVLPAPSLSSEQLNGPIQIPDMRQVRRATSEFSPLTRTVGWENSQKVLAGPANFWKGISIVSPRMGLRIFGESQLLLAVRGYTNAFTDPRRFISLLMADDPQSTFGKKLYGLLDRMPGKTFDPEILYGADGLDVRAHGENMLMNSAVGVHGPETVATKGFISVPVNHPEAAEGLAEMLGRAAADPIVKGVVDAETPQAARDWFWDGEGAKLRLNQYRITKTQDDYMLSKLNGEDPGLLRSYPAVGDIANDREAADRWLDQVVFPRINDLSNNGDTEILDALRTGKLGGARIYTTPTASDAADLHANSVTRAQELINEQRGPQNRVIIRDKQPAYSGIEKGLSSVKNILDSIFLHVVDLPDQKFNRIPTWRQFSWEEGRKLLPLVDAEAYGKIMTRAEGANLPDELMQRLRNTALDGGESRRLSLADFDKLVNQRTAARLSTVVHDLTTRSQFFDMVRFLIPFGDAFRLVAQRWLTAVKEEPQILERLRQGVYEAKQPGSAAISRMFGDPVPHGQGFFHKDAFGQDVLTVPGSTWFNTKLLGAPIPLQAHTSGLSMLGEGYPGLGGPSLTLPAKWLIPNTPTGDKIRHVVFPYGGAESQGLGADIGNEFIPSWAKKIFNGPIDERARANSFNATLQALAYTGKYDLQGPDAANEHLRLVHDAEKASRLLYVEQGIAQGLTPGAPSPETYIQDPSGRWVLAQVVGNHYRDHITKDGPQAAMSWFLSHYGAKNIFVTQKASQATGYAAPVTKEAQAWVDSHPGVSDKFPLTYGFFAPSQGKFDITTYGEQFAKGERRPLTGPEQVAQAENRLGFYIYDQAQQQLYDANSGGPLTTHQKAGLAALRASLHKEYPGFDSFAASPFDTAKRRNAAIEELTNAVKDPAITSTDTGQAVAKYLAMREAAIEGAHGLNLKTPFSAARALNIRNALRAAADSLMQTNPGFRSVWDNIFSHELTRDPGVS